MDKLKICLVSLPWASHNRPSAATSALQAYANSKCTNIHIDNRPEHLNFAAILGFDLYNYISSHSTVWGDVLYAPLLYPDRRKFCKEYGEQEIIADNDEDQPFAEFKEEHNLKRDVANTFRSNMGLPLISEEPNAWKQALIEFIIDKSEQHMDALTQNIAAANYDLVGMTTCFGQMIGNLALAKRIKEASPETKIILGGSTISGVVGHSLLEHFHAVDYMIQGEGEQPFVDLIRSLQANDTTLPAGVIDRFSSRVPRKLCQTEVPTMDSLPPPDFDDYARQAENIGLHWKLPIEASRGCWWDRAAASSNPKKTCYFCNLNVQWSGYREKEIDSVKDELQTLFDKYGRRTVFFLDNIIRNRKVAEFATALQSFDDLDYFYEMRSNITPMEFSELAKSGLRWAQFGIEALSTGLLRKIGKGTTLLQNLRAMRLCEEFWVQNYSGLIVKFPGSTGDDVEEGILNVKRYCQSFQPLNPSLFWLGRGSTVEKLRSQYPIKNIRNRDDYRIAFPGELYDSLELFDLSYDDEDGAADWNPFIETVREWRSGYNRKNKKTKPKLHYIDTKHGREIHGTNDGNALLVHASHIDMFRYLQDIRKIEDLSIAFERTLPASEISEIIEEWISREIVAEDKGKILGLVCAPSSRIGSEEIEKMEGFEVNLNLSTSSGRSQHAG